MYSELIVIYPELTVVLTPTGDMSCTFILGVFSLVFLFF